MRPFPSAALCLAGVLAFACGAVAATFTASMTLSGSSLRVHPASANAMGGSYKLSFTSTDDQTINDELFLDAGSIGYASVGILEHPGSGGSSPIVANFTVDIPLGGDTDHDLVTDFRQVDRAVDALATLGKLEMDDGMNITKATVQATWNRAAGSATGTVDFRMILSEFGLPTVTFHHTFEIFEYQGTLTYEVNGTNVTAQVDLPRAGAAGGFAGPFNLRQLSDGELFRQAAVWTAPGGGTFNVLPTDGVQDLDLPLTRIGKKFFSGVLVFEDGDPTTPFPNEYDIFEVAIIDTNDTDGDGIPNLSQAVVAPPPSASVGIRRDGAAVILAVKGAPGGNWILEKATAPGGPWLSPVNVTLDQTGSFELPPETAGEATLLFRARLP